MGMYLCDGRIGNDYQVTDIKLPVNIEKRLEALGI
jgi:ferrous iron transport protein A